MKKTLALVVLVLLAAVSVQAQKRDGKGHEQMMKEIREFKLKYLAQEMSLAPDQQAQFVDLYTEMSDKRDAVMQKAWRLERKVRKNKDATEQEYREAADAMRDARIQDSKIEKEYDEKFSKFLTSKQMFKMKSAENEFRRKMEEMRHRNRKK